MPVDIRRDVSVVPERTADPAQARGLVARDGAAVLTGLGPTEADAVGLAHAVLAETVLAVPQPAAVREGGDRDRKRQGADEMLPLHSDGFSYGDHYPDHIFLLCVEQSDAGGESFLADGYALLDELDGTDVARMLHDTPIDQTEPGFRAARSTAVQHTAGGRRMLRRMPEQRPDPTTSPAEQARQQTLLDEWHGLTRRLSDTARRFKLAPGEALCVDNYRMLHGRDPFGEGERFLWRVWAWTTEGAGVPHGLLHSDSRYAAIDTPTPQPAFGSGSVS